MKKMIMLFAVFFVATVVVSSCSKDTSPADKDFFVGTYKGKITYISKDLKEKKSDDNGSVTVSKVGDEYNFAFGSSIPNINGVKFEKSSDSTYVSVGSGVTGITVNAHSLKLLVSNDDGTWTADCTR